MRTASDDILRYDLPGIVSACIIPERSPLAAGDSGDAILADPASGIMAVADSPGRNPAAAGSFLGRFSTALDESGLIDRPGFLKPGAFHDLVSLAGRLTDDTPHSSSCTFSCIVLIGPRTAGLLHTGDSFIFLARSRSDIDQLSRTSHFMVGRSPGLHQTEIITLPQRCLLILASDGIVELAGCCGMSIRDFLSLHISFESPGDFIQRIIEISLGAGKRLDDLGVIAVVPSLLADAARAAAGPVLLKTQHTK